MSKIVNVTLVGVGGQGVLPVPLGEDAAVEVVGVGLRFVPALAVKGFENMEEI